MQRKASARWVGTLQGGRGWLTTASETLDETQYSFSSRFENGKGTNPEELIGAAHAGCFSMALAGIIEKAGLRPERLETAARITLDKVDGNWTITASHLNVTADVPGIDEAKLRELAEDAKKNCPVSRALKIQMSVEAHLMSQDRTETVQPH